MRFRAGIQNIHVFTKLTASLASLGNIAWLRLNEHDVRFTIIPEQGTQVWAVLQKVCEKSRRLLPELTSVLQDTIFETYTIQSAAEANTINIEVPLGPLHKALKSAQNAIAASIRLTKKNGVPLLSLTITTSITSSANSVLTAPPSSLAGTDAAPSGFPGSNTGNDFYNDDDFNFREEELNPDFRPDRETMITQDIPIRVLAPQMVEGLHEPRCREHEVQIYLPPLLQLKGISDRFTKLALSTSKSAGQGSGFRGSSAAVPKLELAANMHGCLRMSLKTDAMNISSTWTGLTNPELDPGQVDIATHPSTRMRELGDAEGRGEEGWAIVRVDGRDWGRVLGVGRLGGRVIACLSHEHALVMYVWLPNDQTGDDESVLTFYVSSYSA